jgi:hypothetical protein
MIKAGESDLKPWVMLANSKSEPSSIMTCWSDIRNKDENIDFMLSYYPRNNARNPRVNHRKIMTGKLLQPM